MTGRAEVDRLAKRLTAAFARAPTASADLELQSDFAKYLCVLTSGFFEKSIVALALEYARTHGSPEVLSFVEARLDRWTNPTTEKIIGLFSEFKVDWRTDLDGFLVDEKKASVNSLVAIRHQIAHGESVGITLVQVQKHRKEVVQVLDHIAQLLGL